MSVTLNRRPLATRIVPIPRPTGSPLKPSSKSTCATIKRPRSPEPPHDVALAQQAAKRVRCGSIAVPPTMGRENKERRHAEREQQRAEFKEKYTRAFPTFTFYFDVEHIDPTHGNLLDFEARIRHLGGSIDQFFSKNITHLITNQLIFSSEVVADKENAPKSKTVGGKAAGLKSPVKLKARIGDENNITNASNIVANALSFGIKIWTTAKLDSVLTRCVETSISAASVSKPAVPNNSRALSRLLQSEKIHGSSERDPSQKRHDFRYFSRGSYFILVEDLNQELATIAAHEYALPKGREDTSGKAPWPVLHCHPNARGPFIPYDEKERRRYERAQQMERAQTERAAGAVRRIRAQALKRKEVEQQVKKAGDLRRSVSMNNMQKRSLEQLEIFPGDVDLDYVDTGDASGYLVSTGIGYLAASGNSVGITSATGTTSTAGYTSKSVHLPLALSGRMKHEVLTSRRMTSQQERTTSKTGNMGPPNTIPEKQPALRKCRSASTIRLPKREEGTKPGYCESCRTKFEDFKIHIIGRKHRKFAMDDANFAQLDVVLARVQRRSLYDVEIDEHRRKQQRIIYCSSGRGVQRDYDDEAPTSPTAVGGDSQNTEMGF